MTICVVPSEKYGNRYACVKLQVTSNKPVKYELGMIGNETLDGDFSDGSYFGFGVDAGMGCIADLKVQEEFNKFWKEERSNHPENVYMNPYDDLFKELLKENYNKYPRYQRTGGDWLNWKIPNTDYNMALFSSGWGDGCYPTYFGYDEEGNVTGIYILFINIKLDYNSEN